MNSLRLADLRIKEGGQPTIDSVTLAGRSVARYTGEFWTSKQRQASSIHEISYRACFKPQLPNFFIRLFTNDDDIVYDPFSGRGTTIIEAALLRRNVIANDANPLSTILTQPRLSIPDITDVEQRLSHISKSTLPDRRPDLSMFYHPRTEREILRLRYHLRRIQVSRKEDHVDRWIRMVATNRLTGHSRGFFSVYTLPPNQAVTKESQVKINKKLRQKPEYRDTSEIILSKSKSLLRNLDTTQLDNLSRSGTSARFLCTNAASTPMIADNSIQLTVTSPPFLNVVDYRNDNWLRCWFNRIDEQQIARSITTVSTIEEWSGFIGKVFRELCRVTKPGGWVAFEVGEVQGGRVKLEDAVVPLGLRAGFTCEGLIINSQQFTKTSNIWGISNNQKGTNTNRIVLFHK